MANERARHSDLSLHQNLETRDRGDKLISNKTITGDMGEQIMPNKITGDEGDNILKNKQLLSSMVPLEMLVNVSNSPSSF